MGSAAGGHEAQPLRTTHGRGSERAREEYPSTIAVSADTTWHNMHNVRAPLVTASHTLELFPSLSDRRSCFRRTAGRSRQRFEEGLHVPLPPQPPLHAR